MPELPEVETIRSGLAAAITPGIRIKAVQCQRRDLRVPIPRQIARVIAGSPIFAVRRRAKFLLFDIGDYTMISHLGMSGSWRFEKSGESNESQKHDHVCLQLSDGRELVFNDPRRFGLLLLEPRGSEEKNVWLKNLGIEPLSDDFTCENLLSRVGNRKCPVKNFLMDQKVLVGVGNIYASEVLHHAGVRPQRRVDRLSTDQWRAIVASTRHILLAAIGGGGTTLRDYRTVDGTNGLFKNRLRVYGRAGLPCLSCSTVIQSRFMAGRATYWCKVCQK